MDKVKKDQVILIRTTKEEKEIITKKAAALGLSLSTFLRMKGLND